MISTTELEQEIARRESRLVEGEEFRRAASAAGVALALASTAVAFAALMASMDEAVRVPVSAAAFLAGAFGLGLVLLGVLPHQVTLDMRLALAQLAEKAGEGRDGQGMYNIGHVE